MCEMNEKSTQFVCTRNKIDSFMDYLRESGYKESTISTYRSTLMNFYDSLPKDKQLSEKALIAVLEQLGANHSRTTVNSRRSVIESFLTYYKQSDLISVSQRTKHYRYIHSISRADYMRMLKAAQKYGEMHLYLMIKLGAVMGLNFDQICSITVADLRKGTLRNEGVLPDFLQSELLEFAARKNVDTGLLFTRRTTGITSHPEYVDALMRLAEQAGVEVSRNMDSALVQTYAETRRVMREALWEALEQKHMDMLQNEQCQIGWRENLRRIVG